MKLILACDPSGGIGYKNQLPWDKIEGDLPRFKKLTQGQVIVMGKNTWESLPRKPLPGRLNFVITRDITIELPSGAIAQRDLSAFTHYKDVWLIGGAKLVNSSWAYIDEIHLSRVNDHYDCDTFINLVQLEENYTCVHKEQHSDHSYEIWTKNEKLS